MLSQCLKYSISLRFIFGKLSLSPSSCQCVCSQRCKTDTKLNNFCMQWALCLFWLLVYFNPIVHVRLPEHLSPKCTAHTSGRAKKNREIKSHPAKIQSANNRQFFIHSDQSKHNQRNKKKTYMHTRTRTHGWQREELKQQQYRERQKNNINKINTNT